MTSRQARQIATRGAHKLFGMSVSADFGPTWNKVKNDRLRRREPTLKNGGVRSMPQDMLVAAAPTIPTARQGRSRPWQEGLWGIVDGSWRNNLTGAPESMPLLEPPAHKTNTCAGQSGNGTSSAASLKSPRAATSDRPTRMVCRASYIETQLDCDIAGRRSRDKVELLGRQTKFGD